MTERISETLETTLWEALQEVKDPEIPTVSVVELGMVHRVAAEGGRVTVEMLPTFVGCPALDILRRDVTARLAQVDGVEEVEVRFVLNPPWTSDRITPEGRRKLAEFGLAPPPAADGPAIAPACPYCGARDTAIENLFGPTACRAIFYCKACRQPFEGLKPV